MVCSGVLQLETDEKEMRKEISYAIKNQLGVRCVCGGGWWEAVQDCDPHPPFPPAVGRSGGRDGGAGVGGEWGEGA